MLIYRSNSGTPPHLVNFKNKIIKDVVGRGKFVMITKEMSDFEHAMEMVDDLEWIDKKGYKVALVPDLPLVSDKIVKDDVINGKPVRLGDSNYLIPLIRVFPQGTYLPTDIIWNLDGTQAVKVSKEYLDTWAIGMEILENASEWHKSVPDFDKIKQYYHKLLSVNYEITEDDIGVHGLISGTEWMDALAAAVDLEKWTEFFSMDDEAKKNLLLDCGMTEDMATTFLQ